MKILFFLLILIGVNARAQIKYYGFAGVSQSTIIKNSSAEFTKGLLAYQIGIEAQIKVISASNILTGLNFYQTNFGAGPYFDDERYGIVVFDKDFEYKANYIGVPILYRLNYKNRNFLFLDLGWVPSYLLRGNLRESVIGTGINMTGDFDITRYSQKFILPFKIQLSIAYQKFTFTSFMMRLNESNVIPETFVNNWPVSPQFSTYYASKGMTKFRIIGFKIGYRIK